MQKDIEEKPISLSSASLPIFFSLYLLDTPKKEALDRLTTK